MAREPAPADPLEAKRDEAARRAAPVRSRPALIVLLGLAGGVLLMAAELSAIVGVDVASSGTCEEIAPAPSRDACQLSGLEQHGGALFALGGLALVLAVAASRSGSRTAGVGLIAVAAVTAGIIVLADVPKIGETGLVGADLERARVGVRVGLQLEVAGTILCALGGALRVVGTDRS